MQEEVNNWWKQAENDLRAAKVSAAGKIYDWACFQSQQAVEKALKSIYLKEFKDLIKVHDLVFVKQLELFKRNVQRDTPLTKMILFGSRVSGKPHRDSDIDLILVSSSFRKQKSLYRGMGLYKYWDLDYPVDFLCYTPEEFKRLKQKITLVQKAAKEGIEI